jgi:hypothetical protein
MNEKEVRKMIDERVEKYFERWFERHLADAIDEKGIVIDGDIEQVVRDEVNTRLEEFFEKYTGLRTWVDGRLVHAR